MFGWHFSRFAVPSGDQLSCEWDWKCWASDRCVSRKCYKTWYLEMWNRVRWRISCEFHRTVGRIQWWYRRTHRERSKHGEKNYDGLWSIRKADCNRYQNVCSMQGTMLHQNELHTSFLAESKCNSAPRASRNASALKDLILPSTFTKKAVFGCFTSCPLDPFIFPIFMFWYLLLNFLLFHLILHHMFVQSMFNSIQFCPKFSPRSQPTSFCLTTHRSAIGAFAFAGDAITRAVGHAITDATWLAGPSYDAPGALSLDEDVRKLWPKTSYCFFPCCKFIVVFSSFCDGVFSVEDWKSVKCFCETGLEAFWWLFLRMAKGKSQRFQPFSKQSMLFACCLMKCII